MIISTKLHNCIFAAYHVLKSLLKDTLDRIKNKSIVFKASQLRIHIV